MNDQQIPPQRPAPSFTPQHAAAQNMAQNGDMQRPAGAPAAPYRPVQVQTPAYAAAPAAAPSQPEVTVPTSPVLPDSAYTLSVHDVRSRLHDAHISKSKDTVQRYCREGDLDCRKLTIFKQYFVTEASVEKLISTMQQSAGASTPVQLHEAAGAGVKDDMHLHAGASERDSKENSEQHAAAKNSVQPDAGADATASQNLPLHEAADAAAPNDNQAVLQAKLDAANERIEDLKEQNAFLQEEVRESRGNRRDVTAIAQKMLGTLENMALGGRLSDPTRPEPTSAPVREAVSPQPPEEGNRV